MATNTIDDNDNLESNDDDTEAKTKKKTKAPKIPAQTQLDDLYTKIKTMSKQLTQYAADLKKLGPQIEREKREAIKDALNGKTTKNPSKKGGLETPVVLGPKLCAFLGLENGSKMVRNEAKSLIRAYIREKKLNNPDNKRYIIPDKKLLTILHDYTDGDDLTYWTMEKYIKENFIKNKK